MKIKPITIYTLIMHKKFTSMWNFSKLSPLDSNSQSAAIVSAFPFNLASNMEDRWYNSF
jgi:hypothetical protein